ncbi:unnamed protein product [Paramecium sonneborni]|uniref:Kinesin-like protein n=1 Tax=Paramecium sonneborni TaxID=65129 RepID=A0A8S1NE85_9CILI|nr:unnamed protein product [Paramecium sonneborni]
MDQPKIIVAVRKRPLSKKESKEGQKDIVEVQGNTVIVREPRVKVDLTKFIEEFNFNFDAAFDQQYTNEDLYQQLVKPMVQAALNGTKITCFAYGQTGSGKTYTMLGDQNVVGIYTLAAYDLFQLITNSLVLSVSFYEIYCSKLFDLLNDRVQLVAREDAKGQVNIAGLSETKVHSVQEFQKTVEMGIKSRVTGQNSVNQDSSRSHAILQINLRQQNKIIGKLSFIDLAGSERGADVVEYHKQTRIDGAEINKSLLALKECIRALDLNKNHTPFRGSKLTQVLKDSFTGNCRTLMIGTISPCHKDAEHSLNTLRYADRVKELKAPQAQNSVDQLTRELMLPRQYIMNNYLFESPQANKSVSPPKLFDHDNTDLYQDEIQIKPNRNSNLKDKYDELIQQILDEERALKKAHRDHIDDLIELVNDEMKMLQTVDQPNSDIEEYVDGLDNILRLKIEKIMRLRKKLQSFKQHLMDEQDLAHQCQTHFYQKQHQN